jgi:hypothetical protein
MIEVVAAVVPTKQSFWAWFYNSEIILWGYVQAAFGAISSVALVLWYVVSTTGVSPFFKDPKWITGFALVNGVITIWLRQRGTLTREGHLVDPEIAKKLDEETLSPGSVMDN